MNRGQVAAKVRAYKEKAISAVLCACGCGGFTRRGRGVEANRYIRGHATRGALRAKGADSPMFKGGRRINREGYVIRLAPDHPRASHRYVGEHILVAEAALGKPLSKKHPVHHVDHDRGNNRNANLVVCQDTAYHSLLHRRERALLATGDAATRPCGFCHQHDAIEGMKPWGKGAGYAHRACINAYQNARNATRRAS